LNGPFPLYSDRLLCCLHLRLGGREPTAELMAGVCVPLIKILPRYRINSAETSPQPTATRSQPQCTPA
jgi:hypothetical protein